MRVTKTKDKPTTSIRARMDVIRAAGFDPTNWSRKEIKEAATQIDRVRYLETLQATADSRQRRGRFRRAALAVFIVIASGGVGFAVVRFLEK